MTDVRRETTPGDRENTPVLDLTDEDPGRPATAPKVTPFDPEPLRENTRTWVMGGIMALLALTIGGLYSLVWHNEIEGPAFMQSVFPSLVTLAGTALGFYFGGGRDKGAKG